MYQYDNAQLLEKILNEPEEFTFFQIVRLLENHNYVPRHFTGKKSLNYFRFSSSLQLRFSPSEVSKIIRNEKGNLIIFVNFIGLIGATGVLPVHFTETIRNVVKNKDVNLYDAIDIFLHRIAALFHFSRHVYHLPASFEKALKDKKIDPITNLIACFTGKSNTKSYLELSTIERAMIFYAGQFHRQIRSASALQQILSSFFNVPISVETFKEEWVNVGQENHSVMGGELLGSNNCLGQTTMLGVRVRQCQNKFRIIVGPIKEKSLFDYLPNKGVHLKMLCSLIERFCGLGLKYDIQFIFIASSINPCGLSNRQLTHLGWNSRLYKEKYDANVEDVILNPQMINLTK